MVGSIAKVKDDESNDKNYEAASFEIAIEATGFGKYNIILFLIMALALCASMFESTSIAYVVPVAECDLQLDLQDKGYLMSAAYLGMLPSAMIWGFLSDTLGRRKVIIVGLVLNTIIVIVGGLSQSFTLLLIAKFFGGFTINGPHAIHSTILSENNAVKYRARSVVLMGVAGNLAQMTLPLIALQVLSTPIDVEFLNLRIHSWNVFIIISAIPSFACALGCLIFVTETPKFLMTSGRNEEALKVLKRIYHWNTGKHPDTFPVKQLLDERYTSNTISSNKVQAFKNGFWQMKPLFQEHFKQLLLFCTLECGLLMGYNCFRLWFPQIFTFMNNYRNKYDTDANICTILDENIYSVKDNTELLVINHTNDNLTDCSIHNDAISDSFVYYNMVVISTGSIICCSLISILINYVPKKKLYVGLGTISGLSGAMIYFAPNSYAITALATSCLALAGVNSLVLITIIVDVFPTTLRTMATAIALMIARMGSMIGNLIFPYLIAIDCWPPFLYFGSTALACAMLAGIALPTVHEIVRMT